MTASFALVERIGQSLYGGYWHKQLAADLDISDRAFRVWRSGRSPVPAGIWGELAALLEARSRELLRVATLCGRAAQLTEECGGCGITSCCDAAGSTQIGDWQPASSDD